MNRQEVEAYLQMVFANALNGDGFNHPVRITLRSGLQGSFLILENVTDAMLGLTEEQRVASINQPELFNATYIRKDAIVDIYCPNLE